MNRIAKITQKKLDKLPFDFDGRLYYRCAQEVNNFFPGVNLGISIKGKKDLYSILISKKQLTDFIFGRALEQVKNNK